LQRRYLLCCVRLSPEKEPERFVALATELQARGAWAELAVTPYLVGPSKSAYAEDLKRRFREQVPAGIVQETFLGPRELAAVFAKTALNVHPCRYDAFGMTIVEAASQGAPSIMQEVRSEVSV
jgi:glycosyltransferase involved in cell wall biosynthesis